MENEKNKYIENMHVFSQENDKVKEIYHIGRGQETILEGVRNNEQSSFDMIFEEQKNQELFLNPKSQNKNFEVNHHSCGTAYNQKQEIKNMKNSDLIYDLTNDNNTEMEFYADISSVIAIKPEHLEAKDHIDIKKSENINLIVNNGSSSQKADDEMRLIMEGNQETGNNIPENKNNKILKNDISSQIIAKEENCIYVKRLHLQDFIKSSQLMISDYICSLCKGVYYDPVVDTCGHVFCKECLEKFLEITKQHVCPITKACIDINMVGPIKFVAQILEKQTLKCLNKFCDWLGKLSDLNSHLKNDCVFEMIKCSFIDCETKVERRNLKEHEENCDYKHVNCELCSERILLIEKKSSHSQICKKEKIECFQGCGNNIERDSVDLHIKESCPSTEVECYYSQFGCKLRLKKKDLKFHLLDEVNTHNLSVCKFLLQFKNNFVNRVEKIERTLQDHNIKMDDIYLFLENDLKKINQMIMLGQKRISNGNSKNNDKMENGNHSDSSSKNKSQNKDSLKNGIDHEENGQICSNKLDKKKLQNNNDIYVDEEQEKVFVREVLKRSNSFEKDLENSIEKNLPLSEDVENFCYLNKLEIDYISDGIEKDLLNPNTFTVVSDKKKHKFILAKNRLYRSKKFKWTIKINKISGWMAFGLGEKEKISKNLYKFNGVNNTPHGCFLVSSNKYIWNNNIISQNNCFINELPAFKNGDEICFSYIPEENILKFKVNQIFEGILKKIFSNNDKYLVPCCIMINKNDGINIEV